ncbi:hypothetical protein BY996DRAFT_6545198 [Phakopsora pachyrhizi]|nr:hypothetical protein BY996DRAFT_6545198 [Phakopsora pachyrhizi]
MRSWGQMNSPLQRPEPCWGVSGGDTPISMAIPSLTSSVILTCLKERPSEWERGGGGGRGELRFVRLVKGGFKSHIVSTLNAAFCVNGFDPAVSGLGLGCHSNFKKLLNAQILRTTFFYRGTEVTEQHKKKKNEVEERRTKKRAERRTKKVERERFNRMSGKNKYQSISYDLSFDHDDQTDIINQRVLGLYNRSNKRSRLTDDHQLNRPDNINPEGIINNQPDQKGHHQSQDQSNSSLLRSAADNANPSNDNLNLRLNKQRQPITRTQKVKQRYRL